MTATGGRSKAWRWAVGVWAALVLTGGGLTLWLQEANEPDPPARWKRAPAPLLSADVDETSCPTPTPATRPVIIVCAYSAIR
ncbi:hypothetical protein ACWGQ5_19745 [Streptomyces sp. NPDC055722]